MSRRRIERNENLGNDIKLVATLFVFACISGCTTTDTAVVTGQERSPIDPAAVTLYFEPPAHYEVVGIVKAHIPVFSAVFESEVWEPTQRHACAELKKEAAKIGANGVIDCRVREIREFFDVPNPDPGGPLQDLYTTEIVVTGTAIYVISNSRSE